MNIQKKKIAATAVLIAGIASATVVYADGARQMPGSMMDRNGVMGQMQQMMANCNAMMQSMMNNTQTPMQSPLQSPDQGKTAPGDKKPS